MNLKELTETIILKLVKNTEAVSVEENEEDNQIIINAYVSNEDMGRVIGKDGKIINSIRTILQASSYMQNNISVKLNVLEKKD
ncbi:MAG: KH domain-containing protein [Tenericutes bacterium]|nr:KH domain-containing protein [Mycoplasmatota bacterium]